MIKKKFLFTFLALALLSSGCSQSVNTPAKQQATNSNTAKLSVASQTVNANQTADDIEANDDTVDSDQETNDDPLK